MIFDDRYEDCDDDDWRVSDEEKQARQRATIQAEELLTSPFFFRRLLGDVLRAGLVGERRNALALYVIGTSRLRPRPINALVKGASSSGKNFLARKVLDLFPPKSVHESSSMSSRALNFVDDDDLKNSILYHYELEGSARTPHPARLLISEGKLVHWFSRSQKGVRETRQRETGGPVACISTTTQSVLAIDDESRNLSLWIDESPQQTKRITAAYTSSKNKPVTAEMKWMWWKIQKLLEERKDIPIETPAWFDGVVEIVPTGDVRIRRYWPAMVESCKTISLIRSFGLTKDQLKERGRLTVKFVDFAIANLIFDRIISKSISRSAPDEDVQTAEMLQRILDARLVKGQGVEALNLVGEPGVTSIDKAYRLLRRAETAGTIVRFNKTQKNNEKFYIPTPENQFVGTPEYVFNRIKIANYVAFVHPLTGEWVRYRR